MLIILIKLQDGAEYSQIFLWNWMILIIFLAQILLEEAKQWFNNHFPYHTNFKKKTLSYTYSINSPNIFTWELISYLKFET